PTRPLLGMRTPSRPGVTTQSPSTSNPRRMPAPATASLKA
ncbi:uncharacterized protein METZ01_LOCUS79015, partial [marine metagenome]